MYRGLRTKARLRDMGTCPSEPDDEEELLSMAEELDILSSAGFSNLGEVSIELRDVSRLCLLCLWSD